MALASPERLLIQTQVRAARGGEGGPGLSVGESSPAARVGGDGSGLQPGVEGVWRVRNVVAPELFGCSRGLHDTPVAPLPVLTQVFKAFTVGSQSPLPYKAGWRKGHPQAVEGSVSLMGIEADARKQ